MIYADTVKALRCCTDSPRACSKCPAKDDQLFCVQKLEMEAAEAIERLQKEIKLLEGERDWLQLCVNTLPQPPKWINVKEQLPEKHVPVLCLHRYTEDLKGRPVYACQVMSLRGNVINYWEDSYRNAMAAKLVLFWMPLPEIPEDLKRREDHGP